MTRNPHTRLAALAVAAPTTACLVALSVPAADGGNQSDRATLQEYATDTWASFEDMIDPATGLPADNVAGDLSP